MEMYIVENIAARPDVAVNVPQIVFEAEPELEKLSAFAWKCAAEHISSCPGAPQSPYMDEAFAEDRIWIWDTCFMVLYCKYAPEIFPGVESLRNFYLPMLDGVETPLKIHIPDTPPLFAWAEWENYRITGDREHLKELFFQHRYPQRMFRFFESLHYGDRFPYMSSLYPVQWQKTPFGYPWSGGRCGMDNTPRGDFPRTVIDNDPAYRKILFLDAAAQQALSARIIWEVTGDTAFRQEYDTLAALLNHYYWDEEDGCYYDIEATAPHRRVKVMTPASFWPLLAGVASPEQAARMAAHAENAMELGGPVPFPSVARNSPHFDPAGGYWRGGVWLPTAYMAVKALEQYQFTALADRLAEQLVRHQLRTWLEFSPHTVWEVYSPTRAEPATCKYNCLPDHGKPDFCGWSALGPINLTIENVLGIQADGVSRMIHWRLPPTCRHGIRNLSFGGVTASLEFDRGTIAVETSEPFRLKIEDRIYHIPAGVCRIKEGKIS